MPDCVPGFTFTEPSVFKTKLSFETTVLKIVFAGFIGKLLKVSLSNMFNEVLVGFVTSIGPAASLFALIINVG